MSKVARPQAYSALRREIGARILWARELVEPNRAAFARACGIDRSTVQKIEDGTRTASIFDVLEFSHRLRVSTEYILRGSMLGVDAELADLLLRAHPELATRTPRTADGLGKERTAPDGGTSRPPRTPRPQRRA